MLSPDPLPQFIYPRCSGRITDPITTRMNPPAISARCPTALPRKRPIITPKVTMISVATPMVAAVPVYTN